MAGMIGVGVKFTKRDFSMLHKWQVNRDKLSGQVQLELFSRTKNNGISENDRTDPT